MRKVLGLSKSDFNSIAREIQEIKKNACGMQKQCKLDNFFDTTMFMSN